MWEKMETPTIVYDLDTSGGLMEQIQTLLAPPKSEDGEKRSRKLDRSARRTGRATNHDTCDSCREGGDLLCCDHCPAAFHLQCCNPPLSREMLPPGDWMCHRCMVRRKKREQKKEQINGILERQLAKQMPSPAGAELELGTLRLDPTATVSTPGLRVAVAQVRLLERRPSSRPATPTSNASSTDTPTPSEQNDIEEDLLDVEDEAQASEPESSSTQTTLKRPFDLLIAAAMQRNPTQFQLPNELTCTTALPGTSKKRRKEETTGKNMKRPQHELDHHGLVPLPVKVCYTCSRSCRLAPLIQCDYCPLLFHMDCLDPPLTAMPTGRWMCPNHIEHIVLNQRSLTLSNRCQLFDQFQDHISQHAIKVNFLQRIHRRYPPNRQTAHSYTKKRLKVPDAIKSHYQSPPILMAPAGIRNGELICTGIAETCQHLPASQHLASEADQQEWLRGVISLQCSILKHLSAKQTSISRWNSEQKPCLTTEEGRGPPSPSPKTDSPNVARPCSTITAAAHSGHQGVVAPHKDGVGCGVCTERPCGNCGTTNGPVQSQGQANGNQKDPQHASSDPATTDLSPTLPTVELPNHTTDRVVVKLEASHLKACTGPDSSGLIKTEPGPSSASPPHRSSKPSPTGPTQTTSQASGMSDRSSTWMLCVGNRYCTACLFFFCSHRWKGGPGVYIARYLVCWQGLSALDDRFIRLLAWQRIQQLCDPKALPPQPSISIVNSSPVVYNQNHEAQNKDVQARAVFYPLTGKAGAAVNMCYRSLYIGTGADMDVCLTKYGHCNYVSGKHACIFYDENTKQYELLNYSEHGTTVDNVLYSCDFSEKSTPSPAGSLVSKVQNIIRECPNKNGGLMSGQVQEAHIRPCSCKASGSSLIGGSGAGWEGTALLHHGSCIKVGCLQFIFSITEFASKFLKEEELLTLSSNPSPGQQGASLSLRSAPQLHQVPVLHPKPIP
uniref:PHD finger protein 12 n=1 Tax=Denticeps clupeoides TaxID=299321 RepID=A0AAY4BUD2_9TELE